jgi:predicted chitinase
MLLEKRSEINTGDLQQIYYLRDIVIATLPADLGSKITRKMAENSGDGQIKTAWLDGYVGLQLSIKASLARDGKAAIQPITTEYVIRIFPQLAEAEKKQRIDDLLRASVTAGITAPIDTAVLLTHVLSNTNFLAIMEENLNWKDASRLARLFRAFKNIDDAEAAVGKPEVIANTIYANRLGNTDPGDGWKFRGRGYVMTTGRANYARSAALLNLDLINNPDALFDSAVAAREIIIRFLELSDRSLAGSIRSLNGGIAGLSRAQDIYEKLLPSAPKVSIN